jgi:hypothetical protein
LFPVLFYTQTRSIFVETLQNNLILLIGLITFLSGKKFVTWETLKEPRSLLNENMLQKEGLI